MRAFVIALALVALFPMAALAQGLPFVPGTIEFAPTGGASVPFGDFNSVAEPGFGLGGTASFYLMPNLALGGSIMWNSYSADVNPSQTSISNWEFTGHAKYLFIPGPISPYAKAAAGIFMNHVSIDDPTLGKISESKSDLGVGGGLGIQARIPKSVLGLFGEAMAYDAFSSPSNTTYYTVRVGLNIYNPVK
jgi:outer membrane protein with beta-barrel domain